MRTTAILALVVVAAASAALVAGCRKEAEVRGTGESGIALTAPSDVSLTRGGTAQVTIRVERRNTEGDISVSFSDLPSGVSVADADKKIVGNEGVYTLRADDDATLVTGHEAMVTVTGPEGAGVAETFGINVTQGGE